MRHARSIAPSPSLRTYRFSAMACSNELKFYASCEREAQRIAQSAIAAVRRIEAKYSRYRQDSVLTAINQAAGKSAIEIDHETHALLEYADTCFQNSAGLFDITSGVLRRAWNFRVARIPRPQEISALLPLVGWHMVERSATSIRLPLCGMELDFGGIGKEYAADVAAACLVEHGVRHGFVNLGGDIRAIGPHEDGSPWSVGIADPRKRGRIAETILLVSGAITTSGDYERFFVIDGTRYCHILNPRTGWPVTGIQSITTVAESCLVAGSVCTIAMLLGPHQAQRFLEESGLRYVMLGAMSC